MLAQALSRRFADRGIHYGWAIVAVTFLVSLVTAGAMGLPGALILPLSREFGWNTEQISGALALRILLFGLMAPFAAALIERYGLKRVILSALVLISMRPAARAGDEPDLASRAALGHRRRPRHRHDRAGDGGDRLDPMVHGAARAGARHAHREFCDRSTGLSAARRMAREPLRLALGARAVADRHGRRRRRGAAVHGRPPRRRRTVPLWRDRKGCSARAADARVLDGVQGLARSLRQRRVLGARRDLLHLRLEHERPDSDPFHFALRAISASRRSPPPRCWR